MFKKKNFFIAIFILIFIVLLCSLSVILGYKLYQPINFAKTEPILDLNAQKEKEETVAKLSVSKINPSTKMVYEYYYKDDSVTEKIEDTPPYFLLDLTREEIEKQFDEWKVKSFSDREVVLQMVLEGESTQHYIIGEYDGYVAVFYEKEIDGNNLKDITGTPISSLPLEEQKKIKSGIKISGEKELYKYLENYES